MFKDFFRRLVTEPVAPAPKQAAGKSADTAASARKRGDGTAETIAQLKRQVGAVETPAGTALVAVAAKAAGDSGLADSLRAAFGRPDIPLTPQRLTLINDALRQRARLIEALPASTRQRLADALARQMGQSRP